VSDLARFWSTSGAMVVALVVVALCTAATLLLASRSEDNPVELSLPHRLWNGHGQATHTGTHHPVASQAPNQAHHPVASHATGHGQGAATGQTQGPLPSASSRRS
jgi:hypothetical protein